MAVADLRSAPAASVSLQRVGITTASNFPRLSLGRNGQVVVREGADEIATDFDLLRQAEGWDHTTLDLIDAVQVSTDKVHFKVVISRRHQDGAAYRTAPGLYVAPDKTATGVCSCSRSCRLRIPSNQVSSCLRSETSFATITSVALMIAVASLPRFSCSSSTASLVMTAIRVWSPTRSRT